MAEVPRLEDSVEFAENPEPRCPCVLLLDTSGSMQGAPIEALNRGLQTFKDDLMRDPVAPKRVEVAVVTFDNDVTVVQDFVTADRFEAPLLECQGMTHMAAGINTALDMIQARNKKKRPFISLRVTWAVQSPDRSGCQIRVGTACGPDAPS